MTVCITVVIRREFLFFVWGLLEGESIGFFHSKKFVFRNTME